MAADKNAPSAGSYAFTGNSTGSGVAWIAAFKQASGNQPPVITKAASAAPNPAQTNQSVAFSVTASDPNGDTLSYSWTFGDGANGSGASVSHAYTTAGNFTATVVVSDGRGGTVNSSVAVTVNSPIAPPVITAQPANATVNVGQSATFSVTATGTGPLSYQWQKNGTNISGATGSSYTTPAATHANNGSTFRVIVSNAGGSVTSTAATLTVSDAAPAIISPASASPASQFVGQSIMFSASASDADGDALTYSWNFGDSATGSGPSILHAYAATGTYTATVTVSDGFGGSVTSSVTVTVTQATAIDCGGGAVGSFAADQSFSGGSTYATSSAINTSGVTNPAPQAVYQSNATAISRTRFPDSLPERRIPFACISRKSGGMPPGNGSSMSRLMDNKCFQIRHFCRGRRKIHRDRRCVHGDGDSEWPDRDRLLNNRG